MSDVDKLVTDYFSCSGYLVVPVSLEDSDLDNDIEYATNGFVIRFPDTEKRVSDKDMVAKILSKLPPRQAEILRLYYMEGYNSREIKGWYGVSAEWIRRLRNKGLRAAAGAIDCENL